MVAGVGFEPHDLRVMRTSLKYKQTKKRQKVCEPKLAFGDNLATSGWGISFAKFLTEDQHCGGVSPPEMGSSRNVSGQRVKKWGERAEVKKAIWAVLPIFPFFWREMCAEKLKERSEFVE